LHQIAMSATNLLLRDAEAGRQQQQERYLQGVLEAQEDERRRIAHELHDTVAQDLAALRLEIERLADRADAPVLRARLGKIEQQALDMMGTVRNILLDLRLPPLEAMGLAWTLQEYLERVEREHGIRGVLSVDGDDESVGYEIAVPLFRIFQESVQNVVQHADAGHVVVTLTMRDAALDLTIEDDGKGFETATWCGPDAEGHRLGLLGMEERARLLRGSFDVSSQPGEGTTVHVNVPRATEQGKAGR